MPKKTSYQYIVDTVNEISYIGEKKKLGRFYTEDKELNGRIITVNGNAMINFGSCGYLGLELDPRLKEAAIDAVNRYGTYFSSSRLYASCGNYAELEELLAKMFNKHILLTTNLSLGHHSVMPIIIGNNDLVIFDQQAHISMQELSYKLKHFGTQISLLRHSRLDELETKIEDNKSKYDKIWYVTDGVYSMFGDMSPAKKIIGLLNKHKKLHLYVDDAHGMSWAGPNGTGFMLSQTELHPKMVLATSFAKGFGSCGGVFIFNDLEMRDKVRRWGGPLAYSGPQEPATVAAAIASAKIHLSDEIYELQTELQEKIQFCNHVMEKNKLPLVSVSNGPIFYVGLGLTKMGYNMIGRLLNDGFYTNMGVFPAVPESCTGMRFTLTRHLEFEDIENLGKAIAQNLPKALKEENRSMKDIFRAFRKFSDMEARIGSDEQILPAPAIEENLKLELEVRTSIKEIKKNDWNRFFVKRGNFDYDTVLMFENTFADNQKKEDNWQFFYYIIRDSKEQIVLATFFSSTVNKDDMLAEENVSRLIEEKRLADPYYLTSTYFLMGSLLSNGNHLYLDQEHPQWEKAMEMLLNEVWAETDRMKANALYFRDFEANNSSLNTFMMDHGFIKVKIDRNNFIRNENKKSLEDYILELPHKKRQHLKRDVIQHTDQFTVKINQYEADDLDLFYKLYQNVQKNNLKLNTFPLPFKLFKEIHKSKNWEIISLSSVETSEVYSVIFCIKGEKTYNPVIIGLNYNAPSSLNIYKQSLFTVIKRGLELESEIINLGITADESKRKFGVESTEQLAFVQIKDHYNQDLIDNLKFSV